jgi:predicted HNH restriction endonuclease
MILYTVIAENDESQWDDRTGESYHFPNRYKEFLPPGTMVIYYKGRLRDKSLYADRLSSDPHYFGIATIGSHYKDIKSVKNDWYAKLENYRRFGKAVSNKKPDGNYYELIPKNRLTNYWRDGVRLIDKATYDKILSAAGFQPHAPTFSAAVGTPPETIPHSVVPTFSVKELPDKNDIEQGLTSSIEGDRKLVFTTIYERDPALRDEAVRVHGTTCAGCGFNFEEAYGEYGKGYIHIHHRSPISEAGGPISVNPVTDLVPLCANCHSIVHRRKNNVLSLEQLIGIIRKFS